MAAYGSAYYPNQTGAVTTYAVPFEYLSADDVTVEVAGSPVAFTFISSGVVSVTPAPVGNVYIYRTTDITEAVTEFKNGAGLLASDLNSQVDQLLFAVQEASDASSVSLRIPEGERGVVSTLLPSADERATRTLVFDADGNISVSEDSYVDNAANAAQSAVEAAQSASDAADAVALADAARVLSEAARDASGDYANDAQGYALSASGYADASAASASAAQAIVDSIGQETVEVVVSNRTLVLADNGKLLAVDASSGAVVITLPLMSTVGEPYRVTVKKTDNTANGVSVVPSGSDTINGAGTSVDFESQGSGCKFFADTDTSPDNWVTQDFGVAVGDATPVGTEAWFAGTTPPPGWLVENGGLLSRDVYPDLWEHVQASGMLVTEASWQSTVSNRAKFSSGDGSTTFRLPDNVSLSGLRVRTYTSSQQVMTAGTTVSVSHGLGAVPTSVIVTMVCTTAEHGYAVGDVITMSPADNGSPGSTGNLSVLPTASSVDVIISTASTGFTYPHKSTRIAQQMTNANWRMVITAIVADTDPVKTAGRLPIIKAFSVPVDTQSIDVAALAAQVTTLQTSLAALPLTRSFVSSQQLLTTGTTVSVAHGLGGVPKLVTAEIVCVEAELGYSIGDTIILSPADNGSPGSTANLALLPTTTTVDAIITTASNGFTFPHKSTRVASQLTNSRWRLVVRAWA